MFHQRPVIEHRRHPGITRPHEQQRTTFAAPATGIDLPQQGAQVANALSTSI
jgi:hypothetical protein